MTKYILLIFFILIFASINFIKAQDKINTDRPDETESAILTPIHFFQFEFGFGKENFSDNNYAITCPTFLFKYGLSKNFELRLENSFIREHQYFIPQPKTTTGFQPLSIGFRTSLLQEKKIIPQTALITSITIPSFASKSFIAKHLAPTILLAMQNDITNTFGVSYNIGAQWDGFTENTVWLYSLSCGFDLSENWDAFIEIFGAAENNATSANNIDGGLGYYINNNIKLDASAGFGISNAADKNFFGIGISFRFK